MLTVCLTCTGDRPFSLMLAKKYLERAKKNLTCEVKWLVVDDGKEPFDPGDCTYIRRKPSEGHTLIPNLLEGIRNLPSNTESLIFWEDDDWYRADYLTNQLWALTTCALHGYCNTLYYNVPKRCYKYTQNRRHASLFETAIRKEFFPHLNRILQQQQTPYLDLTLWRSNLQSHGRCKLTDHIGCSVGLKGLPGRLGIGVGHRPDTTYKQDTEYTFFKQILKTDSEAYIKELANAQRD